MASPAYGFCGACGAPRERPGPCASCGEVPVREPRPPRSPLEVIREERRTRERETQTLVHAVGLWLVLLVAVLSSGMFAAAFGDDEAAAMLAASVLFGFVVGVAYWQHRGVVDPLLRVHGIDSNSWWLPLAVFGGLAVFMIAYLIGLDAIGARLEDASEPFRAAGWPVWSMFVLGALCPGVFEEVAFRGVIQTQLGRLMSARDALLVQAIMFSILHLAPLSFVSHFVMGAGFGYLRLRTGSLWPGIAVHALWNASVIFVDLTSAARP